MLGSTQQVYTVSQLKLLDNDLVLLLLQLLDNELVLLHLQLLSQGLLKGTLLDKVGKPNPDSLHPNVGDARHHRVIVLLLEAVSPPSLDKVTQILCSVIGESLQIRKDSC